ncbi:MAG: nitroreductase [Saprospiraceae bacterium]
MQPSTISQIIRKRRSIFPKTYTNQPIDKEIIAEVLENANWAPTHKMTEPWRFKVLVDDALIRLRDWQVDWYHKNTPPEKFSDKKLHKLQTKPLKAGCMIAICMQRDEKVRIPEWEEVAAVACAVQNMWLTTTAYDIGAYWSSPGYIKDIGPFLKLAEGERCLGFFYMGHHNTPDVPRSRQPIKDKVEWL